MTDPIARAARPTTQDDCERLRQWGHASQEQQVVDPLDDGEQDRSSWDRAAIEEDNTSCACVCAATNRVPISCKPLGMEAIIAPITALHVLFFIIQTSYGLRRTSHLTSQHLVPTQATQ
jgi:hypothetical protein